MLRCRFLSLHSHINPRAITEFVYRYSSPTSAFVFLSFYLSSPALPSISSLPLLSSDPTAPSTPALSPTQIRHEELSQILSSLRRSGMKVADLSNNELAKSHARYLVGGKKSVRDERLFRFEFPEKAGALKRFLEGLRGLGGEAERGEGEGDEEGEFNISLFHYRNHGGG